MSKQETPKREKLYVRRRWVLRRFAVFLLVLLAVNHFMQIGFLLPIQGIRQVEERQGAPHGRVLARDWAPEIHRTHLVYLTAAEDAVTLADTYLSLYGWMGGFLYLSLQYLIPSLIRPSAFVRPSIFARFFLKLFIRRRASVGVLPLNVFILGLPLLLQPICRRAIHLPLESFVIHPSEFPRLFIFLPPLFQYILSNNV